MMLIGLLLTRTNMFNQFTRAIDNTEIKTQVYDLFASATTSGGSVVFYLTDDGTASGGAVFQDIIEDSISLDIFESGKKYNYCNIVISEDKNKIYIDIRTVFSVLFVIFVIAVGVTILPHSEKAEYVELP